MSIFKAVDYRKHNLEVGTKSNDIHEVLEAFDNATRICILHLSEYDEDGYKAWAWDRRRIYRHLLQLEEEAVNIIHAYETKGVTDDDYAIEKEYLENEEGWKTLK